MEEIYIKQVDEKVFFKDIKGLKTYVFKKEGFSRKMVSISVDFGSTNTCFSKDSGKSYEKYPEGIAHFLEHKLFESDKDNIFEKFSSLGASVNAFTDYNTTCYYFTCIENHIESTKSLINMVFNPHITDENVEKEKGIITEELKLYMDNPQSRLFTEIYDSMYSVNPVRFDIGGTVESVNASTKKALMDCYNAYYQKENMVLVAVGDIDPNEFAKSVEESIEDKDFVKIIDKKFVEPRNIRIKEKTIDMKLASPQLILGLKDNYLNLDLDSNYRRSIIASLFTRLIFGRASEFYEENYTKSKINDSFFCEYTNYKNRGELFIGMETKDKDSLIDLLKKFILVLNDKKYFDDKKEDLELLKKAIAGNFINRFNFIDSINHLVFRSYLRGTDPFKYTDIIKEITTDDLYDFYKTIYEGDNLSTVYLK